MKILAVLLSLSLLASCGGGGGGGGGSAAGDSASVGDSTAGVEDPNTSSPPSQSAPTPVEQVTTDLNGLSMDDFFEGASRALLRRSPETVVADGLVDYIGMQSVQLDDISDAYTSETYSIMEAVLLLLQQYDRSQLSKAQQLSYDIYEWHLQDQVNLGGYLEFSYPANPSLTGIVRQTELFFSDLHPFATEQDARDYLLRLGQIDTRITQLLRNLRNRERAGIIQPAISIGIILRHLAGLIGNGATASIYYQTMEQKLNQISLDETTRVNLLVDARAVIEQQVIPAFQSLETELERLELSAPSAIGFGQFDGGKDFYQQALPHHTSTDLTADEIHQLGLSEISRIHSEIRMEAGELGYPETDSMRQIFSRLETDGGMVPASQIVATHTNIIALARSKLDQAFLQIPAEQVRIIGGQTGGYYIEGSYDGMRPGAFYVSNVSDVPAYGMATLAYHEAVPGHHFQIALSHELDLPNFRTRLHFTAFVEGWALYAEQLAWELGWYNDDPYGNLGRLQFEAMRAARLVVDTGIHFRNWEFDEAADYFAEATGLSTSYSQGQILRYMLYPGQATAYMVGMRQFLLLRQQEQIRLESDFDLKEFHARILGSGAVPMSIIEQLVDSEEGQ